jgi:regulator of replication initiation timing
LSLLTVIGWAIILATALVRLRREVLAHDVKQLRIQVSQLTGQVRDLEAAVLASREERTKLEAENAKLRRRCTRLVRQIKRMQAAHQIQVAGLHAELDTIKARLDRSASESAKANGPGIRP